MMAMDLCVQFATNIRQTNNDNMWTTFLSLYAVALELTLIEYKWFSPKYEKQPWVT